MLNVFFKYKDYTNIGVKNLKLQTPIWVLKFHKNFKSLISIKVCVQPTGNIKKISNL